MKTFISFCLLLAGVTALPQKLEATLVDGIKQNNERLITGSIVQAIEEASQQIKAAGLDPFYIERKKFEYALPVPILFSVEALIEDLFIEGLSDIVVHKMNYNIITSRLTFDIRLPLIQLSIGKASKDITVLGYNTKSSVSGSVAIVAIRLKGDIRFRTSVISGISIRDIEINIDLGDIVSKLKIAVNGLDISRSINALLGKQIPEKLKEFSPEFDELLTIIFTKLIEDNL